MGKPTFEELVACGEVIKDDMHWGWHEGVKGPSNEELEAASWMVLDALDLL